MKISRKWLFIIAGIMICFGCSLKGFNLMKDRQSKGKPKLSAGIKSYEDGNYKDSAMFLKEALNKGLSDKADQIKAHKYLAFIYCVSGRRRECSHEFRKVLEADPDFELQAAEAEHPIWGPVYRSVKAAMSGKNKPR